MYVNNPKRLFILLIIKAHTWVTCKHTEATKNKVNMKQSCSWVVSNVLKFKVLLYHKYVFKPVIIFKCILKLKRFITWVDVNGQPCQSTKCAISFINPFMQKCTNKHILIFASLHYLIFSFIYIIIHFIHVFILMVYFVHNNENNKPT